MKRTHVGDVRRKVQQVLDLEVRPVARHIRLQRSLAHVLHDDQHRRVLTELVDLHDVLVLELSHDLSLSQEIAILYVRLNGRNHLDGDLGLLAGYLILLRASEYAAVVALQNGKKSENRLKKIAIDICSPFRFLLEKSNETSRSREPSARLGSNRRTRRSLLSIASHETSCR